MKALGGGLKSLIGLNEDYMKILSFIACVIQSVLICLVQLPLTLVGLFIIPIGLLFRNGDPVDKHILITMPSVFWLWDNYRDGAMGDRRLWYWLIGYPKTFNNIPKIKDFLKMWWWLAIRNPINNSDRNLFGCDVSVHKPELVAGQYHVRDEYGEHGWQLVKAKGKLFNYYGFYHVLPLSPTKALVCRIGFKIEPSHATDDWSKEPTKALKGSTFRPYLLQSI